MEPATANGRELDVLWPTSWTDLAPNQRVWLASSKPLMLAEYTAVVAVPNEFTRTQLEGRLRTRIEDTLSESLGKPVRLAVSVDDDARAAAPGATRTARRSPPPASRHGSTGPTRPRRRPPRVDRAHDVD